MNLLILHASTNSAGHTNDAGGAFIPEAINLANSTSYGLAAGVWTCDLSRAHHCACHLHAGTVWVNCYNVAACNIPNPGMKLSGFSSELGREGFEAYTRLKNVCVDLMVRRQ